MAYSGRLSSLLHEDSSSGWHDSALTVSPPFFGYLFQLNNAPRANSRHAAAVSLPFGSGAAT